MSPQFIFECTVATLSTLKKFSKTNRGSLSQTQLCQRCHFYVKKYFVWRRINCFVCKELVFTHLYAESIDQFFDQFCSTKEIIACFWEGGISNWHFKGVPRFDLVLRKFSFLGAIIRNLQLTVLSWLEFKGKSVVCRLSFQIFDRTFRSITWCGF